MTLYTQSRAHLNEELRSDILLLSSHLSGRTCALKSNSVDPTLALYADIATLLTICNDPTRPTQNVAAVIGNHTTHGMDFFVYIETARQMDDHFTREAASTQNSPGLRDTTSRSGSSCLAVAQNAELCEGGFANSAEQAGDVIRITPLKANGRKLLDEWDPRVRKARRVEMPRCAFRFVHSVSFSYIILSDLSFDQHLQDLFDVIIALNDSTIDLLRFQLFIHHRAFYKLGHEVREFSTHWGKLPFDILSDHIDTQMERKTFRFNFEDPTFHRLIQSYVNAEPHKHFISDKNLGPVYTVSGRNARLWIKALRELWLRLQSYLSLEDPLMVREYYSSPAINDIITTMFVLEALMPVFKHLVSTRKAVRALSQAGRVDSPFVLLFC